MAVDVDGTLMDSRNELPVANKVALHKAHQAGMMVCLCTGRSLTETRAVIDQLGLDSDLGIFVFGAIVSELPAGKTLYRTGIDDSLTERLITYFRSHGHAILVLYDASEAGFDYHLVRGERFTEACEQWLELAPTQAEEIDEWLPGQYEPIRIGVIEDPKHIDRTLASLKRAFPPEELKCNAIYAPNYGLHVVECFAPQVSKWHGIKQVAGQRGIDDSQIAAIGDDINDLEMIRHAGFSVAMGNAIEQVKAAANLQVPTHDQNGVAKAVEAILGEKVVD
ncbi:MAG: HAD family hydrolase [Planctomycetota bacterium]|nr:MAG: HAD family hydrolase [Planctomycetota bacterium]